MLARRLLTYGHLSSPISCRVVESSFSPTVTRCGNSKLARNSDPSFEPPRASHFHSNCRFTLNARMFIIIMKHPANSYLYLCCAVSLLVCASGALLAAQGEFSSHSGLKSFGRKLRHFLGKVAH